MAKAGRGSDQFMVRLPEGMRETIRVEADNNGRSMNAEIVARLEAYTEIALFRALLISANEQRDQLLADLETKDTELEEIKKERDSALRQAELVEQLLRSIDVLHDMLKDRFKITDEIVEIIKYIESDGLCLRAEIDKEMVIPSASSPQLNTPSGKYLCEVIDIRTVLFARLAILKSQTSKDFLPKELMTQHAILKN